MRTSITILLLISCHLISSCKKNDSENRPVEPSSIPDSTKYMLLPTFEAGPYGKKVVNLTCFNGDNSVKWKRINLGNAWDFSTLERKSPSYFNNVIYYAVDSIDARYNTYSSFHAIDINTGTDLWNVPFSSYTIRNPVVRNDTMYCALREGFTNYVAAFHPLNGFLFWRVPIKERFGADHLFLEGNTLFFVSSPAQTSIVNSFDLTTRTLNWQTPIGANVGGMYSYINISRDVLCIANGVSILSGMNKLTGANLWSKPKGYQPLFLYNDLLYTFDPKTDFTALNPLDGSIALQWASERPNGSVGYTNGYVLAENDIYVAGIDQFANGFLKNFDPKTGALIWTKDFPLECALQIVTEKNIYISIPMGNSTKLKIYDRKTVVAQDSIMLATHDLGKWAIITTKGKYISSFQ